jgi:hypothetical protein
MPPLVKDFANSMIVTGVGLAGETMTKKNNAIGCSWSQATDKTITIVKLYGHEFARVGHSLRVQYVAENGLRMAVSSPHGRFERKNVGHTYVLQDEPLEVSNFRSSINVQYFGTVTGMLDWWMIRIK